MSPRLSRRTPTPLERAAIATAAKAHELDGGGGGIDQLPARGDGLDELPPRTGGLTVGLPTDTPSPTADLADGVVEADDAVAAQPSRAAPVPRWRQMLEVFLENRLAVVSSAVLLLIVLFCYVGPLLYGTNQTNGNDILSSTPNLHPSGAHLLGTDSTGYDELGRIMFGGQYSLSLGFFAGVITILIGTVYGMVAGFFGGLADTVMMRIIDAALSIPYLFLLIALVTIFDNSTTFLLLVIGLTGWWGNSRIIRGDALVIRDLEYSVAAVSMGATRRHVIRRHVFPNSMSNIVTVGTFSVADAILALSALGFIGIGIQSPATDWGFMMNQGTQQLVNGYWWETYPVAIVFVTVILCINYIGDALRDVFEVRLRQR